MDLSVSVGHIFTFLLAVQITLISNKIEKSDEKFFKTFRAFSAKIKRFWNKKKVIYTIFFKKQNLSPKLSMHVDISILKITSFSAYFHRYILKVPSYYTAITLCCRNAHSCDVSALQCHMKVKLILTLNVAILQ